MRPRRVFAIARRDLALELSGRRGWVLPLILVGLLFPTTTLRFAMPARMAAAPALRVSGDVPEAVRALDVAVVPEGQLDFRMEGQTLVVKSNGLRDDVRAALDGDAPALTVNRAMRPIRVPGRSLLFALISASTLTGAVSTSMAGERAAGTLVGLLAAAVSRFEIMAGKWLAWGGLGAAASLIAAGAAIVMGRITPGWWLLPLPIVAPATVALGFWLVRRATDVVTGTTVSLRVLPAVLSITGLGAWFAGRIDPLLGASVPLGGALVAAGGTWDGPLPAVVAFTSSLALSLACLWATARDLEDAPSELLPGRTLGAAAAVTSFAAGAWWLPIAAPVLWGAAGNPTLTEELPRAAGVAAAGLGLLLLSLNGAASTSSLRDALGVRRPTRVAAIAALAVGALLMLSQGAAIQPNAAAATAWAGVVERLGAAVQPTWAGAGAGLLAVIGQEVFFRGWVQQRWGPVVSVLAFAFVVTPLAPLSGLVVGVSLSGLIAITGGSVLTSLGARLTWAVGAAVLGGLLPPLAATALGLLTAIAIGGLAWRLR